MAISAPARPPSGVPVDEHHAPALDRQPAAPMPAAAKRSRWWAELLAVAWLAWLYDVVTGLAPLRQSLAIAHGRSLLRIEQALHVAVEHSLNVWLAAHHALGVVLSYYYDNAHFVVTFGLLGWLWWKRPDVYRPLRNALVGINLIGLLVFWRFPVAPPRMLGGGFTDVVATSHTLGSWHTGSLASDADQLAAMPSLHIAWAVWCGVALWRMSPRRSVRALALLYPLLTTVVVLSTANHYLLDVLAGALTAAVAVAAVHLASVLDVTRLLRSRRAGTLPAAADDAF
ncbi:MAG: phosphatase PAP2 family protein [Solirubrobacteraceae bacterium]